MGQSGVGGFRVRVARQGSHQRFERIVANAGRFAANAMAQRFGRLAVLSLPNNPLQYFSRWRIDHKVIDPHGYGHFVLMRP